jgi:hypothetical protein
MLTPVFFTVDFDAGDPHISNGKDWIIDYFARVRTEREVYARENPGRYYLIGVYGGGQVLRWCYESGWVDSFWQTMSPGFTGSEPAKNFWPWYHANRWQYQGTADAAHPLPIAWNCIAGIDPDADWGDGGDWSYADASARDLLALEQQEATDILLDYFIGLIDP